MANNLRCSYKKSQMLQYVEDTKRTSIANSMLKHNNNKTRMQ